MNMDYCDTSVPEFLTGLNIVLAFLNIGFTLFTMKNMIFESHRPSISLPKYIETNSEEEESNKTLHRSGSETDTTYFS